MFSSLSTLLLSVGLMLSAGNQPPEAAGVLIAQDESPSKARPGRPPTPNLKGLRQLKRPGGSQPGTGGSRFKPVKPSIRPRHKRSTPRKLGRPDKDSGKPGGPQDSGRTRKLRSPQKSPDDTSFDEEGEIKVEKEKRCRPLPPRIKVLMNFNEAEVLEIVQWISEQTCKNFIVGDNIRGGKLTILSKTPVSADEAYRAFLSALNVNNMTVVKVGNFYKIQMKRDAAKDTIPTFVGKEEDIPSLDLMVTRVVQLKYVDANTINGTVKQLCTKDGDSHPYAPTNTLIISDTGTNIHRLTGIIDQLDTPLGQEEIRVVQVNFALATELAQTIEEIFGEKGGRGRTKAKSHRIQPVRPRGKGTTPGQTEAPEGEETVQLSKVIADERTNKLILVAASRSFPKVLELINKLDVPIPGEGQIQVVYLQHADAEELASTLTSLAQGSTGAGRRSTSGRSKGKSAAGVQKAAELFQGEVKVTADQATNSLVIVANQNDFKSLNKVIKRLDIRRRQVFVEAVIMEVNVDTTKDVGMAFHGGAGLDIAGTTVPLFFGTQYKAQGSTNLSSLNMLSAVQMLGFVSGLSGPELSADKTIVSGISLPSFGVIMQALQTDSNVNVLSTPHILTSDNEEAEIKVGENIPIPAGYGGYGGGLGSLAGLASMASGTTGTTATTSRYGGYGGYGGLGSMLGMGMGAINRQEVGLTLKIKPQINEGNVIRMELEEELSEVKDTSNPLGPTTTQRSAKTVVEVQDQQTVVVGGLMRDKIDIGETKVPVLGDIPVIGWFFRSRRQQKTKTNLLLFLTPYVVQGPQDFRDIFERKMRERREFLERFYGAGPRYKTYIDFRRKHGPLADIHLSLRAELDKIENGGQGSGREILITPVGEVETSEQGPGEQPGAAGDTTSSEPESSGDDDTGIVEETLVPAGEQPDAESEEHRLDVE